MRINTVTSIRFGEIDEANFSDLSTKSKSRAFRVPAKDFLAPKSSKPNLGEAVIKGLLRTIFRLK